ncbi:hypothetical protein HN011_000890 [Eciton burchellii]|nr:hypothetical protein HN011_000890 [Eciton burchellii]
MIAALAASFRLRRVPHRLLAIPRCVFAPFLARHKAAVSHYSREKQASGFKCSRTRAIRRASHHAGSASPDGKKPLVRRLALPLLLPPPLSRSLKKRTCDRIISYGLGRKWANEARIAAIYVTIPGRYR